MSAIVNLHGDEVILEPAKVRNPLFNKGVSKIKEVKGGAKILVTVPGVINVHYAHNPPNVYTLRNFNITDEWYPDRIDEIKEEGTTIAAENILIGY